MPPDGVAPNTSAKHSHFGATSASVKAETRLAARFCVATIPAALAGMPRWFSFKEVAENKPIFSNHIGDEAYQQ